jgi:PAS domain S-box-containing protein
MKEINGRKLRVTAIRDVSARNESERALRESEAKYRALVEATDTGYVIMDAQGRALDANAEYVRLTGHSAVEEIRGRSVLEWTAEYHREKNSRALEQCVAKGFIRNLELDYIDERGCVIPIEVSATAMPDDKCGMQLIGLCRDVTYYKMTENRLRKSLNEKKVLIREVHHRVKNNLAVIASLINLQQRYAENDALGTLFEATRRRIRSMALAHEMLYQSANLAEVSVREYIRRLIGHLSVSAFGITSSILFKQEVEDASFSMEATVPLGLILNELVTNCIKHAFPDGRGGEIRISFRAVGEKEFELSVADNGVGLPEGIDMENPKSLGLELIRILAEQLRGSVEFGGVEGTEIRVRLKH